MLIVPVADTPAQALSVQLSGQNCQIGLYQKSTGFFCDLYVDNALVVGGVACENLNRVVRDPYLGFVGDLAFVDTQGTEDPTTPGLGSRWKLVYLTAAEASA